MPVNIGVNIQRSPNRINQQLREAGVEGKFPKLLLDFKDQYYLASGGSKTLANAVTHARSGNAVMTDGYGPELVVNGGFDSDSDWDEVTTGFWSIADGAATMSRTTIYAPLYQDLSISVGTIYSISFTVSNFSGTSMKVGFTTDNGMDEFGEITAGGVYTFEATPTNANRLGIGFARKVDAGCTIDNVSVREMPTLKWAPHNLLTYSEDLSNAAWSDFRVTIGTNAVSAPDGSTTADSITPTAVSGTHYVAQTYSDLVSVKQTISAFVKSNGYNHCFVGHGIGSNDGAWFNLSTGSVGTTGTGITSASMDDVGDGWFLCSVKYTTASTPRYSVIAPCSSDNTTSFTGDGSSGIYVWGIHRNRSDLGGMVDNPDRGDSYVPTAGRATGPELVTNGTFNSDISGWTETDTNNHITPSYNNGKLRLTSTTSTSGAVWMAQTLSNLTTGQTYIVTADITITGTATASVILHNPYITSFPTITSSGRYHFTFKPTATSHQIRALVNAGFTSGSTVDFDNISLRKSTVDPSAARYLPRIGHHVYNGSAWVNEGLLAESEARVNDALYSTILDAQYNKTGASISDNSAVAPTGVEEASTITENTANGNHRFDEKVLSSTNGTRYTFSIYAKKKERSVIGFGGIGLYNAGENVEFDLDNGIAYNGGTGDALVNIQDVGNGWFRCMMTYTVSGTAPFRVHLHNTLVNSAPPSGTGYSYTGDGTSGVYVWGLQIEEGDTASSFIPNSGTSAGVTRPAETFTIPSANLPWPEPNYIGTELVTNGTFDSDVSGWSNGAVAFTTFAYDSGTLSLTASGANARVNSSLISVQAGKLYLLSVEVTQKTSDANSFVHLGTTEGGTDIKINITNGDPVGVTTFAFVATNSNLYIQLGAIDGNTVNYDNISVREINPLSVSIAMDGRMTYADEDGLTAEMFRWQANSSNTLRHLLYTTASETGQLNVFQSEGGTSDSVASSATQYSPDILVPFDISGRHGSTFVNGATEGVALTANTTPTALPDLSATDLSLAYDFQGTIGTFRVWDRDIADTGLVEATNPSLEPSLSLTFEGTGTNSFIVNDWSE